MRDKIVEFAFIIEEIVFILVVMPVAFIIAIWDAVGFVCEKARQRKGDDL